MIACVTDHYESRLKQLLVIESSIIALGQLGLHFSDVSEIYIILVFKVIVRPPNELAAL